MTIYVLWFLVHASAAGAPEKETGLVFDNYDQCRNVGAQLYGGANTDWSCAYRTFK